MCRLLSNTSLGQLAPTYGGEKGIGREARLVVWKENGSRYFWNKKILNEKEERLKIIETMRVRKKLKVLKSRDVNRRMKEKERAREKWRAY